jgi:hypothetical protein
MIEQRYDYIPNGIYFYEIYNLNLVRLAGIGLVYL